MTRARRAGIALGAVTALAIGVVGLLSWQHQPPATASSHREAPLIASDPEADSTDLYAFIAPDAPDMVTIISAYNPLEAPEGGPNFYKFGDDVLYRINIDNDGDAEEDIAYEFRFHTVTRNGNTFLYNTGPVTSLTDPNLNVYQTYTVTRVDRYGNREVILDGAPVAPVNVGKRSFPDYEAVWRQAIVQDKSGAKFFAGQADDPFWVDLRVFDLLQVLPPGQAKDSLAGFNVHVIAMQIPITALTRNGSRPTSPTDPAAVIGVWATNYRPSVRVLNPDGSRSDVGQWVQVSRLGHPLVNEVVVPRGAKDLFNASHPRDDAQFLKGVTDPELAALMNLVLNFPAPTSGRDDLVQVFLTGVPGLTMPPNVKPAEMLRLNVAVPPSPNPNRLGVLAGDLAGFPNGRRLTDDVVDIELQAVGGVLKKVPGAETLSQGVPGNDVPFQARFPYVALPHPGNQ
ncbi:MAG: hypothetical protein C4290_12860 [Chloroflexota bacterium]